MNVRREKVEEPSSLLQLACRESSRDGDLLPKPSTQQPAFAGLKKNERGD